MGPPSLNAGEVSAKGGPDDDATGTGSEGVLGAGATEADRVLAAAAVDGSGDDEAGDPDEP
jgi:hypothetical protein